jgi:ferredoxin
LKVVRVLSETSGAIAGRDFEAIGRVDMPMLSEVLPFNDYDFYLCGPSGYMQGVYDGLRGLNIADSRIHAEAFGPSALHRQPDAGVAAAPARNAASDAVQVTFVRSGKQAQWVPGAGSLLELAEAQGLAPEFSCRSGTCGACRTRVVAGAVAYRETPAASVGDNEALICCSVPAEAEAGKPLHLQLDL